MSASIYTTWLTAALVSLATVTDLRRRRIPNLLTFPAAGIGLAIHAYSGGWGGLLFSLGGLVLSPLILVLLHGGRGLGMGDIKLAAAIGSLLGPILGGAAVLVSAVAGGVLAAGSILGPWLSLLLPRSLRARRRQESSPPPPIWSRRIPYGVAISAGTLLTLAVHWATGGQPWPF